MVNPELIRIKERVTNVKREGRKLNDIEKKIIDTKIERAKSYERHNDNIKDKFLWISGLVFVVVFSMIMNSLTFGKGDWEVILLNILLSLFISFVSFLLVLIMFALFFKEKDRKCEFNKLIGELKTELRETKIIK